MWKQLCGEILFVPNRNCETNLVCGNIYEMQRRNSKGSLQAQPGQLGLLDFDFGGSKTHKEAAKTQVETAGKPKQRPASTSTSSAPKKSSKVKSKPDVGSDLTQRKRGRTDNKSPPDTNKPPSKKQNKGAMSGTKKEITTIDENKVSTNADLLALEKRLFAGFALLIDPLKKDIEQLKNNQSGCANCDEETSEKIDRKFRINEEKQRKLDDRLSLIEDQLLEKNIIFQGIRETEYDDRDDLRIQVVKTLANLMDGDTDDEKKTKAGRTPIESVERLGKYNPQRTRPVKVKFGEKMDAIHVLKNKRKLPDGVFAEREYSKATEKERRLVRPVLKAARKLEKYKGKVHMSGPHIVIDGKHFHRNNIHTLPMDLEATLVTSKTDSETYAFFGELNPLSNFHRCNFNYANEEFHSSEQFIQLKKAEYFKDEPAMTRILASTDAQDSKDIARDITNYNHKSWSEHAEELCYDGIKNKFMQNPRILNHLLETRDKTIIEACTDEVWGSGISLGDKNCLNATKWTSIGIMGKILMKIRDTCTESEMEQSSTKTSDNEDTD